ncbi:ribosome maturation factor RimP [Haliovirga abyssi]|uniref:Ribosome maturation factor RimP n=1 Tax=Haliovirga abyssi TaxID=2996794 RepID=A0AAU9DX85_9FUSO|nr:ribosome maturation factor RimP [Haliovirga abyssi]BDU49955.1 ribosome maturation factor RimP [Haliovirga abyssi]
MEIQEQIFAIIEPITEEMKLELVDVEYVQDGSHLFIRVYIDKDGGVDLDDCEKVSRAVEEKVDSIVKDKFFLEVSSPGLERPLKKEKDFSRFEGEKALIRTRQKIMDKRKFEGRIKKYENGIINLEVENEIIEIEFKNVKKANLIFEFEEI